ncbi:hypothetical protein AGABI2DRAFT_123245 [Agaricus bisporus var. bisporus H97]|uniref:hypothetical protein n=1 Tax=Agaricus bisporus var. bisporus (strain H97 / ATCC MYA-4626 / FGSC 10389) TaxID=936046 RepID=UPI00029F7430|nr:hypothetical protein AGABI2DRAFT_123245 [Agaricus bisporus var. bisporus H97]EKV41764.1 hypothetical protein AGABI2DRAFT_123245 [Agaricus bisporus var. bisporus H97]
MNTMSKSAYLAILESSPNRLGAVLAANTPSTTARCAWEALDITTTIYYDGITTYVMSRFDDLPLDIIREIIGHQVLTKADLCNLRRASKNFGGLVNPLLFATLSLDSKDITRDTPEFPKCQEIITALADSSTTVFAHTRQLKFDASRIYSTKETEIEGISRVQRLVVERIFDAISSLQSLQFMNFYVSVNYPERLTTNIISALGTLTSFEGFNNLTINENPPSSSFSLQSLSNLTVFRMSWVGRADVIVSDIASLLARCPQLSELYLANNSSSLQELFAKVVETEGTWKLKELQLHGVDVSPDAMRAQARLFKHLTCLEIRNNSSLTAATDFGTICEILQQEQGVLLKSVSTDYPEDPLLLSYLCSHSGLTKLCFDSGKKLQPPDAADSGIYMEILERHLETLEHLQLHAGPSWNNLITEMGLLKCQRLRTLRVDMTLSWEQLLTQKKAILVGISLSLLNIRTD